MLVEDLDAAVVGHRRAGPCALRGLRPASVVASTAAAARLAASVSLLLAATKVADHVDDGQTPRALRPLARRWERAGRRLAEDVGLDPRAVLDPVADQARLEAVAGRDLRSYTAPTEAATAAAFAHASTLAGRPAARAGLAAAGAAFGRLAHLLDAVEDQAADRRASRFNPLTASGTPRAAARAAADGCVGGVRDGLAAASLSGASLAHRLLVHEAGHAVGRAFSSSSGDGGRAGPLGCQLLACSACLEVPTPAPGQPQRWRDRCGSCCDGCGGCCEGSDCCCSCCACCDGCDCCGCDCP